MTGRNNSGVLGLVALKGLTTVLHSKLGPMGGA